MRKARCKIVLLLLGGICLLSVLTSPQSADAKSRRRHKPAPAAPVPAPAPVQEKLPAGPPPKAIAPPIVLAPGLRFVVRPTLLGLVPPEDESGYGDCYVRVITAPGPAGPGMRLFYEVKERIDDSGLPRANQLNGVTDTQIRRGDIYIADLTLAERLLTPLDWANGSFNTKTGLLWLSSGAYDALLKEGSIPWSNMSEGSSQDAAAHSSAQSDGAGSASPVNSEGLTPTRLLVVDAKALYPCRVNGAMVDLPAMRLVDSEGKVDYWLLAEANNPLILKVSPRPAPLPPAPSAEASGRQSVYSKHSAENPNALAPPITPEGFGAGFAIVEIDF
jgi:hypothetical protein